MENPKVLYLIGPMGSGKSFVGKAIATKLNLPFLDLDALIEEFTNQKISQLFKDKGEANFRKIEAEMLRKHPPTSILATGGGTPCFHENMEWMNKNGITLYLRTTPGILQKRLLNEKDKRPLIAEIPDKQFLGFLENMIKTRAVFYEKAQIIYNQELSNTTVVHDILKHLRPFLFL